MVLHAARQGKKDERKRQLLVQNVLHGKGFKHTFILINDYKNRQISHLCMSFLKQPSISHSPMKSGIWENILLTKTLPLASMTIICKWQITTWVKATPLVIRSVEQGWSQFQSIQKENLIPIPNVPHWKTMKSIGIGIQWTAWIDWKWNVIYSNPEVVIRVTDWLTYRGLWSHQGYRS